MLDKKTDAVLELLALKAGTSYKVLNKNQLLDDLPKKLKIDLQSMLSIVTFLSENEYVDVKYQDKEDIRHIAKDIGLVTATKKDSQDICFIEKDYTTFLEENMDKLPDQGDFVLSNGKILGKHKGIIYYTIGQRKGLGISYQYPLYVIEIDKVNNQVILGNEEDLYHSIIEIRDVHLLVDDLPLKAEGKIRYKYGLVPCKIDIMNEDRLKIIFEVPVKSATLGQSLVLYDKDICLGGGIIDKVYG